jgi:MscS family membrane protein
VGLGVGGLAVALAAQETIRNFFGSLIIFTDKPFEVGERVVVDTFDGVVEEIGFRSSRIRTLTGHLVTIPNGELANKSIENIGKRPHIRRLMNISITYDTPAEKIEEAVEIAKRLLDNHEGMDEKFPPKVFFNDYGNFHLNILVLYWYHPADYWKYMEFSEKFNLQLFKEYEKAGIEFAFPTSTVYVAGDPNRPFPAAN